MPSKKPKRTRITRKYVDGDLVVSRCPKCGCTDRTKYFKKECFPLPPHFFREAKPCTHVVYRFTRCTKCNAWRRDRSFENRD